MFMFNRHLLCGGHSAEAAPDTDLISRANSITAEAPRCTRSFSAVRSDVDCRHVLNARRVDGDAQLIGDADFMAAQPSR